MGTAFRVKTAGELIADAEARARVLFGVDVDLSEGSVFHFLIRLFTRADAEQYVQIAKLLSLFSLFKARGDDLDERFRDLGSDFLTSLRRKAPTQSTTYISVGDATTIVKSRLLSSVAEGATSFTVSAGAGDSFAAAGEVMLEPATEREERVAFTRTGDVFTVITTGGTVYPHPELGEVRSVSLKSYLDAGVLVGATSCVIAGGLAVANSWPASGSVIFERGTVREEKKAFTRSGTTLTFSALAFAHAIDTSLHLSTFGSNRSVPAGTGVYVQSSQTTKEIYFKTTETGTLYDGDYFSDLISSVSDAVGSNNNVGANQITKFTSLPFANATVTNPIAATGGQEKETDDAYRKRGVLHIQGLSRGTRPAIESFLTGLEDPETKERLVYVYAIRPVDPTTTPIYIYVTDGSSGFALTSVVKAGREVLITDASEGDARATLGGSGPYQKVISPSGSCTPRLFRSVERGEATSVGVNTLTDTTKNGLWTLNQYAGMFVKTDDDQFYEVVSNTTGGALTLDASGATPSLGAYCLFDFSADPLIPDTDYYFHEGTGDIELLTTLEEHDGLVAADDSNPGVGAYTYTTGIGALANKTLYGDATDLITYPGVLSYGEKGILVVPVVVSPFLTLRVVAAEGFTDSQIAAAVKAVVVTYVNSLGIGENIKRAEIIKRVQSMVEVSDVDVITPKTNVSIADGQLARITDANITIV